MAPARSSKMSEQALEQAPQAEAPAAAPEEGIPEASAATTPPEPEGEAPEGTPQPESEPEGEPEDGTPPEDAGESQPEDEQATLEQRLKDSQAWGHKMAERAAKAEKENAALQKTPRIVTGEVAQVVQALPARIKAFGEEYGEEAGQLMGDMGALLTQVVTGVARFEESSMQANFAATLAQRGHSDYVKTMQSAEFAQWWSGQMPIVQAGAESENPADVAGVLDMYKKDSQSGKAATAKAAEKAKADARKANTGAPGSGNGPPTTKKKYTRADLAKMRSTEKGRQFYKENHKEILANYEG